MRSKIFVLALLAGFLYPINQKAQSFTTGISLGISTSSVNFTDIGNAVTNTIKGKNIMGFEGGAFERINFGALFVRPMLLASYQGGIISFYNKDGSVNTSKFDYGKIETPLLFGIKILGIIRIEGGPVYNWIYTTKYDQNDAVKIARSGLGYRIGANVGLGMIYLGFAYQGITNKSSDMNAATFASPNELIFNVALCFGKNNGNKR